MHSDYQNYNSISHTRAYSYAFYKRAIQINHDELYSLNLACATTVCCFGLYSHADLKQAEREGRLRQHTNTKPISSPELMTHFTQRPLPEQVFSLHNKWYTEDSQNLVRLGCLD